MGPRRKPRTLPERTYDQISLTRIHYSTEAIRLFGTPIISTRIISYRYKGAFLEPPRLRHRDLRSLLLLHCLQLHNTITPWSRRYGDVTAMYICRSKVPSHIYAKHQYRQELEYESMWCIIHSNIWIQLQSYHRMWCNITRILLHR